MKPWGPGGNGGTQGKLADHYARFHHRDASQPQAPRESPTASHVGAASRSAGRPAMSHSGSRKRASDASLVALEAEHEPLKPSAVLDQRATSRPSTGMLRFRLLGRVFEIRACTPAESICHDCCVATESSTDRRPLLGGSEETTTGMLTRDCRIAVVCALASPSSVIESIPGTLLPLVRNDCCNCDVYV